MAGKSPEKKRKKPLFQVYEPPGKKAALEEVKPPVKVQFVQNPDGPVPIIASTPGINIPESTPLSAYTKTRQQKRASNTNSSVASSELLLQSSAHPRLDFIGKEGENQLDTLWNHYVAVYDRQAGTLQVVEARKMTVRGNVRQTIPEAEEESSDEEEAVQQTMRSQRAALTETFGTKQSRKAVQSIAENELLAPAGTPTAAETALLSAMPTDTAPSSPQKNVQAEIQAAKPVPQPNFSATSPSDVYSLQSLIPNGLATLRSMPVKDWQDTVNANKEVLTTSRYVSHRVEAIVHSGNKTNLQLLRFIYILLEFAKSLKNSRGGAGLKKIPPREELRVILGKVSGSSTFITDPFLDALRRKFVPQGSFLARTEQTFLHTTLCALSLHIPPAGGFAPNELATEPADLRDDLRLDPPVVLQYFRELGCRVDKPKESEFAKWGVKTKAEASARRIARLKLPLEFPKISRGGKK